MIGAMAPLVFIGFWLVSGLITAADYSPFVDAISRLAASGSDVRWVMTAGFVLFGAGMLIFAPVVAAKFGSGTATAVRVNGLATFAVAATPLDSSGVIDQLHNLSAIVGYVSLAAIPILAYPTLVADRRNSLAQVGLGVAAVAAVSLTLSVAGLPTGFFQRLGLTSVDLWLSAFAGYGFVAVPNRKG